MTEVRVEVSGEIELYISAEPNSDPVLWVNSWNNPNGCNVPLQDVDVTIGGNEEDDTRPAAARLAACLRAMADKYDPKVEG